MTKTGLNGETQFGILSVVLNPKNICFDIRPFIVRVV